VKTRRSEYPYLPGRAVTAIAMLTAA